MLRHRAEDCADLVVSLALATQQTSAGDAAFVIVHNHDRSVLLGHFRSAIHSRNELFTEAAAQLTVA
jgi:hypothetical protein